MAPLPPSRSWTVAEAEAQLSEIFRWAGGERPQRIDAGIPFIFSSLPPGEGSKDLAA